MNKSELCNLEQLELIKLINEGRLSYTDYPIGADIFTIVPHCIKCGNKCESRKVTACDEFKLSPCLKVSKQSFEFKMQKRINWFFPTYEIAEKVLLGSKPLYEVGENIYLVHNGRIYIAKIGRVAQHFHSGIISTEYECEQNDEGLYISFNNECNENVFRTLEEAEKALAERRGK